MKYKSNKTNDDDDDDDPATMTIISVYMFDGYPAIFIKNTVLLATVDTSVSLVLFGLVWFDSIRFDLM